MWTLFKKPSREEQMERSVAEIMKAIKENDLTNFTHAEQSMILNTVIERYKEAKTIEYTTAKEAVDQIYQSLIINK